MGCGFGCGLDGKEGDLTMVGKMAVCGLLVLSLCLLPAAGWAQQEHGGKEHGGATAAPAVPKEPGGATAAPAVPKEHGGATAAPAATQEHGGAAPAAQSPQPAPADVPAPPALKPITITFTGDLTALDSSAAPASMTVQDRYGVKKEIACPGDCKITAGEEPKTLADLKVGDKLTVEYTYDVATGKRTAQAITVGGATATTR